jgi:hypothetical protein
MKVSNYQVSMNSSYFELQSSKSKAEVSTQSNLSNDKSNELSGISLETNRSDEIYNDLSEKLSKAILKNINNETRIRTGDRL